MGIINAYFPIDRLRAYLTTHKLYGLQYFFASLFGAMTPLLLVLVDTAVHRIRERRHSRWE
jgi:uncharacterized membrane protein YraQ (UPF0718 family)